jgi:choline dehydrogenase-like flavoprotein
MLESFQDKGLPLHHDMFSTGETPHGSGHAPRTVYKGSRSTAADYVTNGYRCENITILTKTLVDKVLTEHGPDGRLKAIGVSVIDTHDGSNRREIFATKEVIVSGGAYCSPAILMRSGLGPATELQKHGIPLVKELPGVGQNLMDHVIVFMFYEVSKPGLTDDHLVYPDAFASTYAAWKEKRTGFLSTFPFGAIAYARLDERLADSELWTSVPREPGRDPMGLTPSQPNIEFMTTECYGGPKQYTEFPKDGQHAFAVIPELFGQRSRGSVTLKSADPMDNPVVDCNYLADPLDMLVLSEACRFANEIVMEGKGTKGVIKGSWPPESKNHLFETREDWEGFVRNHATTCECCLCETGRRRGH